MQLTTLLWFYFLGFVSLVEATNYVMTDVTYYMDELEVLEDTPVHLANVTLVNNDVNDPVIVHTLTYR